MSNIVNLNQFRKRKARADKRKTGDENAARHGQSKAERAAEKARAKKADKDLDGHKTE